jgi:hypothetical protein
VRGMQLQPATAAAPLLDSFITLSTVWYKDSFVFT